MSVRFSSWTTVGRDRARLATEPFSARSREIIRPCSFVCASDRVSCFWTRFNSTRVRWMRIRVITSRTTTNSTAPAPAIVSICC